MKNKKRRIASLFTMFALLMPCFMFLTACGDSESNGNEIVTYSVSIQNSINDSVKIQESDYWYAEETKGGQCMHTVALHISSGYDYTKLKFTLNGAPVTGLFTQDGSTPVTSDYKNIQSLYWYYNFPYNADKDYALVVDAGECDRYETTATFASDDLTGIMYANLNSNYNPNHYYLTLNGIITEPQDIPEGKTITGKFSDNLFLLAEETTTFGFEVQSIDPFDNEIQVYNSSLQPLTLNNEIYKLSYGGKKYIVYQYVYGADDIEFSVNDPYLDIRPIENIVNIEYHNYTDGILSCMIPGDYPTDSDRNTHLYHATVVGETESDNVNYWEPFHSNMALSDQELNIYVGDEAHSTDDASVSVYLNNCTNNIHVFNPASEFSDEIKNVYRKAVSDLFDETTLVYVTNQIELSSIKMYLVSINGTKYDITPSETTKVMWDGATEQVDAYVVKINKEVLKDLLLDEEHKSLNLSSSPDTSKLKLVIDYVESESNITNVTITGNYYKGNNFDIPEIEVFEDSSFSYNLNNVVLFSSGDYNHGYFNLYCENPVYRILNSALEDGNVVRISLHQEFNIQSHQYSSVSYKIIDLDTNTTLSSGTSSTNYVVIASNSLNILKEHKNIKIELNGSQKYYHGPIDFSSINKEVDSNEIYVLNSINFTSKINIKNYNGQVYTNDILYITSTDKNFYPNYSNLKLILSYDGEVNGLPTKVEVDMFNINSGADLFGHSITSNEDLPIYVVRLNKLVIADILNDENAHATLTLKYTNSYNEIDDDKDF